jgi:hypothetical protein
MHILGQTPNVHPPAGSERVNSTAVRSQGRKNASARRQSNPVRIVLNSTDPDGSTPTTLPDAITHQTATPIAAQETARKILASTARPRRGRA